MGIHWSGTTSLGAQVSESVRLSWAMNDGWNFPVIPIVVPEFNGLLAGKVRARIFRKLRKKKGGKEEKVASKYN